MLLTTEPSLQPPHSHSYLLVPFIFICISVLPAFMCMHHMHACCPWRSEAGIRSLLYPCREPCPVTLSSMLATRPLGTSVLTCLVVLCLLGFCPLSSSAISHHFQKNRDSESMSLVEIREPIHMGKKCIKMLPFSPLTI